VRAPRAPTARHGRTDAGHSSVIASRETKKPRKLMASEALVFVRKCRNDLARRRRGATSFVISQRGRGG
jgi:hypothetical protein